MEEKQSKEATHTKQVKRWVDDGFCDCIEKNDEILYVNWYKDIRADFSMQLVTISSSVKDSGANMFWDL